MGRKFWEFRAATDEPDTGELLIYGPIATDDGISWLFDDVTPLRFKEDLDALGDITQLNLFINSPGGDVFAGQAIHSMLRRHPANVTAFVDGLAASIASVVVMAADKVIMPRNAMMMVHNPWTLGIGDAEEFRKIADTLDKIRESVFAAYAEKTGMSRDDLLPLLDAETWMTAEDAVGMGFADEIEEAKKIEASMTSSGKLVVNGLTFNISRFRNRPRLGRVGSKLAASGRGCSRCSPRNRFWLGPRLGALLTQLRDDQDLTTADLAEAAGVDEDTMEQILSGDINCPPRERLDGLAGLLDVPVSRLIDAAEEDGCDYSEDDDDDDDDDEEEGTEDSITQRLYLDYQANLAEMNGVLVP